ncbi:aminotransferase class V-fold PLP-dependent enzyme [Catenovulum sp. SX2]|uniref:aminotransferase class V-fold PLP-dependent enzyme n=1 Tax=Catenovulum sp. SX2 TaxID=3398614 RepID=UPI003F8244F7
MIEQTAKQLLENIHTAFYGADTHYSTVEGKVTRRVYLDSAASCLMLKPAHQAAQQFLAHYANTHSNIHNSAMVANQSYQWAKQTVLDFLNANSSEYACVFIGSGATAAANRVANIFSSVRPNKTTALVSVMEHHSNDLPHRKYHQNVHHIGCNKTAGDCGAISLEQLEFELAQAQGAVNYFALTGASNVTGIINPIAACAELCNQLDALFVLDGSQMLPHHKLDLTELTNKGASVDAVIFSGHKLYVPGAPGILVIKRKWLEQSPATEMGGGMVESVSQMDYQLMPDLVERQEAGTPNIFGAVKLAMSLQMLMQIGMENIHGHEQEILHYCFHYLKQNSEINIYASTNLAQCPRTATFSFNMRGVDHALLAKILNDYFNIAVRNQCFCAHPYVRELILPELWALDDELTDAEIEAKKGMVRASFGLNNTMADAQALVTALQQIANNKTEYTSQYQMDEQGNYHHLTHKLNWQTLFNPEQALQAALKQY